MRQMSGLPHASNPAQPLTRQHALTDRILQRRWLPVVLSVTIFAVLSLAAAVTSKGFLEADACTHYLYARFAWEEWHYFTNVWGRPFVTTIYSFGALAFGLMGARVTSLLLAIAMALVTLRIARNQGYRLPVLALIFTLAQPLVFLHSFSELTELPFAFLIACAFLAYQQRQWFLTALLSGLLPTARPEGFGFIGLALLALVLHRRLRYVPVLFLPLMAWSILGWYFHAMPQPWYVEWFLWLKKNWPYSETSLYDRGHLLYFVGLLPALVSPFVFPALLVGLWRSLELSDPKFLSLAWWKENHRRRCQFLIAFIPLIVLVGHSFLYWQGKMSSNGEPRYMMVVAPFWALLAALGWEAVFTRAHLRAPVLWAGVAALMPITANYFWRVVPIQLTKEQGRAEEAATWYVKLGLHDSYPRLLATDRMLYFFLDISTGNHVTSADYHPNVLDDPPPGVAIIWDPIYGQYNADSRLARTMHQLHDAGWIPVKVFPRIRPDAPTRGIDRLAQQVQTDEVGEWVVFFSPRDINGRATPPSLAVPLPATPTATSAPAPTTDLQNP
jgi:hypothetical protein